MGVEDDSAGGGWVSTVGWPAEVWSRRAAMTSIEWKIIKNKLVPVTAREGKRICLEKAAFYFNAELKHLPIRGLRISFWNEKIFAVNRMQMIVKLYMLASNVVMEKF